MGMSNMGGSRFRDYLPLLLTRGVEGESQITEHWSDIVASRFKVRIYEWLGSIIGMAGIMFSAVLLGAPIAITIGSGNFLDTLVIGVIIGIAAIVASGAMSLLFNNTRSDMVVAILSAGLVSFVVLALVLAAIATSEKMDWWRAALAMLGACIFTPSLAFTFNQLSDLVDPMGWISGFERMMRPYLVSIMQSESVEQRERPVFPWTHNGREKQITGRQEDEDGIVDVPDYLDLELADFLGGAVKRGLSRDKWIGRNANKFTLSTTGRTVTRVKYDEMIEHAASKGYIRKGGDGVPHEWLVEPLAAYDNWCLTIEGEWEDLLE